MRCAVLSIVILGAWGCDPAPEPTPAPAPVVEAPATLPPPGTLRVDRAGVTGNPLKSFDPSPGTPQLTVRMSYAGPKDWIVPEIEARQEGRRVAANRNGQTQAPPVHGHVGFGFRISEKDGRASVNVLTSLTTHAREG